MKTNLFQVIKPAAVRRLMRDNGKRVSREFLVGLDAMLAEVIGGYARIKDGGRRTVMASLLEVWPVKRVFVMPEKKRKRRALS